MRDNLLDVLAVDLCDDTFLPFLEISVSPRGFTFTTGKYLSTQSASLVCKPENAPAFFTKMRSK
jgi:hypothetical protein